MTRPLPSAIEPEFSLQVGRVAAPLREQVLDALRGAILDFRLKPGQRLIERELIEQTGVSRTTIREVLLQLAAEGLVTTIPQKGAVVVVPTAEEARDLYEVRAILEATAVRRFVRNASPAQHAELRAAMENTVRVSREETDDIRAVLQAKDDFYAVLLAGAGNSAIQSILTGLQARVRVLRANSLSRPGRPVAAADELRRMVDAIDAGDADLAAEICGEHLDHASETAIAALSEVEPAASS